MSSFNSRESFGTVPYDSEEVTDELKKVRDLESLIRNIENTMYIVDERVCTSLEITKRDISQMLQARPQNNAIETSEIVIDTNLVYNILTNSSPNTLLILYYAYVLHSHKIKGRADNFVEYMCTQSDPIRNGQAYLYYFMGILQVFFHLGVLNFSWEDDNIVNINEFKEALVIGLERIKEEIYSRSSEEQIKPYYDELEIVSNYFREKGFEIA